jgi:hypothetical protein
MSRVNLKLKDDFITKKDLSKDEIKHLCSHLFGMYNKVVVFFYKEWQFWKFYKNDQLKEYKDFYAYYVWDGKQLNEIINNSDPTD